MPKTKQKKVDLRVDCNFLAAVDLRFDCNFLAAHAHLNIIPIIRAIEAVMVELCSLNFALLMV
jgi:hypothetical protein